MIDTIDMVLAGLRLGLGTDEIGDALRRWGARDRGAVPPQHAAPSRPTSGACPGEDDDMAQTRIERSAELADEGRRLLEADGDTAAGLLEAARAIYRARWELDESRQDSPMRRLVEAAVATLETALRERAEDAAHD